MNDQTISVTIRDQTLTRDIPWPRTNYFREPPRRRLGRERWCWAPLRVPARRSAPRAGNAAGCCSCAAAAAEWSAVAAARPTLLLLHPACPPPRAGMVYALAWTCFCICLAAIPLALMQKK